MHFQNKIFIVQITNNDLEQLKILQRIKFNANQ